MGGRILGVKPRSPKDKKRFSNLVHWQYGSSLGLLRAALGTGMRDPWAGAAFYGTVWAGEMIMVPKLSDNVPPATEWEFNDVAIDGWHHLVAMAEEAIEAGVDYLYFHQVGPDQEGFFQFWVDELQPALASRI